MVVYKKTDGIAHDIRFMPEEYELSEGEYSVIAEPLPMQQDLSDPDAWALKYPKPTANDAIDERIAEEEAALPITPRALREFMLMTLTFARIPASVNPKFQAIADLDARVQALRAQRT